MLFDHLLSDLEEVGIKEPTPLQLACDECWAALLVTMAGEHSQVVIKCLKEMSEEIRSGRKPKIENSLFWAAGDMVFMAANDRVSGREHPPIDLRPEIAEIYLNDKHAIPLSICSGCDYRLPVHLPIPADGSTRKAYFKICPICKSDLD